MSLKNYVSSCGCCGEQNLTIKVTTLKNSQLYQVVCPNCEETALGASSLEKCIENWNNQQ